MNSEQFKEKRQSLGLTLRQMAKEMGYASAGAIHNKEKGERPVSERDIKLLKLLEIKFEKK